LFENNSHRRDRGGRSRLPPVRGLTEARQLIDTICSHVKGKMSSDGDDRENAVSLSCKENEVYIVDGSGDMMAAAGMAIFVLR